MLDEKKTGSKYTDVTDFPECLILEPRETGATNVIPIHPTPAYTPVHKTGNAVYKNCIILREKCSQGEIVVRRYLEIKQKLLPQLQLYAEPTLFIEVATPEAYRFAHPLSLHYLPVCTKWREEELLAFTGDWNNLVTIIYSEEDDRYTFQVENVDLMERHDPDRFSEEVDMALAADAIDSIEHPLVQRILAAEKWGADSICVEGWLDSTHQD
jgi:hypothetical protein